ncbi:hypothetical protein [Sporohalobacter salinus]|uniref:hypothetical protein n=1 Tax=Sporohalobacter salinus TaxID=1494606 RepID=UPI001960E018|nr:hypothetical protein [Sporohalobacter salinus]MBM7622737.1 Tfp pilus assembly protein PilX [Sporohalobacter salinus]
MWNREEGSVIILALVTVVVLSTLVTVSAQMISNEIEINNYNENKTEAFYAAEAGIEKSYNKMYNNLSYYLSLDENDADVMRDRLNDPNEIYNITNVNIENEDSSIYRTYMITSEDTNGEVSITVEIRVSSISQNTVSAGGDVDTNILELFNVELINTNISGNVEEGLAEESLPTFFAPDDPNDPDYQKYDGYVTYQSDKKEDIKFADDSEIKNGSKIELTDKAKGDFYFSDQDTFEEKYDDLNGGILGVDIASDVDLPSGKIIYHNGDLKLGSFFGNIKGGTAEKPSVVVVNGSLTYDSGLNSIEDVIFIVKDDFKLNQTSLTANRTFVYTAGNLNIGGAILDTSLYGNYDGMLLARGNAIIKMLLGEGLIGPAVEYEDINIRLIARLLQDNDNSFFVPEIISWEEN